MRYFIGLGANLGDRLATLRQAAARLGELGDIRARSRVFASAPVGGPPQPPFLNAALALDSALAPRDLLGRCQAIEAELGRARDGEVRWGPRTVDIDVLLAGARGEARIDEPGLEVPHPRLGERGFALGPLVDLDGELVHPDGRPLRALLQAARLAGQAFAPTGDAL